jgi:uncharacterized damage-inducible protein DinB
VDDDDIKDDLKAVLHRYLRTSRADLVAKLDGLGEYDAHRPMTPTGTSLLGLVKHVASVEMGYLGEVFDRPVERELPWLEADAEPGADMWATAQESREQIIELHRYSAEHADATVQALPLDAVGEVPWWPPERRKVTLGQILVHLTVETARHAGHADILREIIDGSAGRRPGDPSMPPLDAAQWEALRARIEEAAQEAARQADPAR